MIMLIFVLSNKKLWVSVNGCITTILVALAAPVGVIVKMVINVIIVNQRNFMLFIRKRHTLFNRGRGRGGGGGGGLQNVL